jgi:hypothetical protein
MKMMNNQYKKNVIYFFKMEDPISIKDIRIMKEFIEKKMNNSQKIQIIDIIKNNNLRYTLNKNGYFINLTNIPNHLLNKIKMFVDFTKDNVRELSKTEDILNNEKTRIEAFDKNANNSVVFPIMDNDMEKNINFEIYSLDGINEIFEEYRNINDDEIEFETNFVVDTSREITGYKIVLKKYKTKYVGNRAKILKRFRDISRMSVNTRSVKTSLNAVKPKTKTKKNVSVEKEDEQLSEEEEEEEEEEEIDDE